MNDAKQAPPKKVGACKQNYLVSHSKTQIMYYSYCCFEVLYLHQYFNIVTVQLVTVSQTGCYDCTQIYFVAIATQVSHSPTLSPSMFLFFL